jgi:DNA-binding CsgD family transcriptional regulator
MPTPITVSSAILFHWATVFPGGSAAAASRVVPADAATASAVTAIATTRRRYVLGVMGSPLVCRARASRELRPALAAAGVESMRHSSYLWNAVAALTARDAERVLRFVAVAEELGGDEPFTPPVLRELGELIPAEWIGYTERDLIVHEHPSFEHVFGTFDFEAAERAVNPICRLQEEGRWEAVTISQLLSPRALRRTAYYRLVLEPLGVTDRLSVGIPSALSHAKRFFFDGVGRKFGARDRLVLDVLQPHFGRLWRAAQTRKRLRAALAALDREDEHQTRGVIGLGPANRIEIVSQAARRLVREYFATRSDVDLPAALVDWLESDGEAMRRGRLTIERSGDALLLSETCEDLGLTARELEILAWVARGKTNAEIAHLLWIAPATVRKHLENVYAKLGVRTRTAAAARFLGVLDDEAHGH